MAADKDVLTTGDVARICRVTIRTVIKWFEQGRLEGYRLPGSGDRRFPRSAVERFLVENDLPLELLDGPPEVVPEVPTELRSDGMASEALRRVLVVDDDESVRDMISRYLGTLAELAIDTASSGWEAGLKTAHGKPHLLLLDYRLGDTTGEKVIETIRAHDGLQPQPAIVIMSAHLSPLDVERILSKGADAFLPKPFDLEALRETVMHHLSRAP